MTSKSFFRYFIRVQITLLILFTFGRLLFILWHYDRIPPGSASLIPGVMLGGLWMDIIAISVISGTCYLVSRLFFFTSDLFRKGVFNFLIRVAFFLSTLVLASDIFYFRQFGTRLNVMAMNVTRDPGPILGTIMNSFPVIPVILAGLILTALFFLTTRNWSILITRKERTQAGWSSLILLLCGTGSFVYLPEPIWTYLPGTSSSFLNQVSLNGYYSFFRSVHDQGLGEKDIPEYTFCPDPKAFLTVGEMIGSGYQLTSIENSPFIRYQTNTDSGKLPNIIIVIVESFGQNLIGKTIKGQPVTPKFDQWIKKGRYFDQFYSNGPRTHHGVVSTISGFPSVLGGNLARRKGTKVFHTLADVLRERGYTSSYFHNGDVQYDDLDRVIESSFDHVYDRSNLSHVSFENEWGACDQDLYTFVLHRLRQDTGTPTLSVLMTVSNHLPYDIPPSFSYAHPELNTLNKMEGGMYYTDRQLSDFLDSCSRLPSASNTYIFVLGDHAEMYKNTDSDLNIFHVPLLVIGPGMAGTSHKTCAQSDVAPSVLDLIPGKTKHHFLGRSVFSDQKGFAFCKGYLNDVIFKRDSIISRYTFTTNKIEHFKENEGLVLNEKVNVSAMEEKEREKMIQAYMQSVSYIFRNGRHRVK